MTSEKKPKELIKGGKSEGMSCEDIANKHGVSVKDIESQIKKGAVIEHEHTPDNDIASEIARDHLSEHPYYYDFLEDMEKEMEKDYDNEEYGPKKEGSTEDSRRVTDTEQVKKERIKKLFG